MSQFIVLQYRSSKGITCCVDRTLNIVVVFWLKWFSKLDILKVIQAEDSSLAIFPVMGSSESVWLGSRPSSQGLPNPYRSSGVSDQFSLNKVCQEPT